MMDSTSAESWYDLFAAKNGFRGGMDRSIVEEGVMSKIQATEDEH